MIDCRNSSATKYIYLHSKAFVFIVSYPRNKRMHNILSQNQAAPPKIIVSVNIEEHEAPGQFLIKSTNTTVRTTHPQLILKL